MEYIITFKSTNLAIKGEQCLLKEKINAGVMPLPPQIRAGCGICLRVLPSEFESALEALYKNGVNEVGLYSKIFENGEGIYVEIKLPIR